MEEKQSKTLTEVLGELSPKTNVAIGAIGVLVLEAIVGFAIMVGLYFQDGSSASTNTNTNRATTTTTTTKTVQPAEVQYTAISKDDHLQGDAKATISVIEFSDLECPFCKSFHPQLKQIVDQYPGKVNWVYRHFPIDSLHSKARKEAEATECAAELGGNDAFWKYLDGVFAKTTSNNRLDPAELPNIAEALGLDRTKFETCLASGKYADKVAAQLQDATTAGGRGTPYTLIISGDKEIPVSGALPNDVQQAIEYFL